MNKKQNTKKLQGDYMTFLKFNGSDLDPKLLDKIWMDLNPVFNNHMVELSKVAKKYGKDNVREYNVAMQTYLEVFLTTVSKGSEIEACVMIAHSFIQNKANIEAITPGQAQGLIEDENNYIR